MNKTMELNVTEPLLSLLLNFTKPPSLISCEIQPKTTAKDIIYAVFLILIMFASIFGNLFVVLAVILSKSLKRRVTFCLIVSLACADFFLAVTLLPLQISTKLNNNQFCHALGVCFFYFICDSMGNTASILNLLLIALDRFVAIKYPYRYANLFTHTNVKRGIASVWIFGAIWSFSGIFSWDSNQNTGTFDVYIRQLCINDNKYFYAASSFGIYISVLVVITGTYITILHVALSQIHAIEATQVRSINQKGHLQRLNSGKEHQTKRKKKWGLNKEMKATKSVAIVYLAYVVCWLPVYIINIILYIDPTHFNDMYTKDRTLFLFIFSAFIECLPALSHMVNPIIYSFSNKQFREASKIMLKKVLTRNTQDTTIHHTEDSICKKILKFRSSPNGRRRESHVL